MTVVTDEMVERGAKACREITFNALTMDECRDATRAALTAALADTSKVEGVTVELAWNSISDDMNRWDMLSEDERETFTAFAAVLAQAEQPVAWRFKLDKHSPWAYTTYDRDDVFASEPLYALSPSKIEAGENTAETAAPVQHVSGETYAEKHGELRRLRAVRGLSTRAMAAEIGISAATLNRAENGETVSVDVAAKLGPYIGECLCCGQPVWAPPQSKSEGPSDV